ncbi:MAG: WD40 repeat domain-containing protein [Frankia sp.]
MKIWRGEPRVGRPVLRSRRDAGSGESASEPEANAIECDAEISALAFSPSGRFLVAATRNGRLTFWDFSDPAHPRLATQSPKARGHHEDSLAFRPDGRVLATGSFGKGTVTLWDVPYLASMDERGSTRVVDRPRRLSVIKDLPAPAAVAFHPDGRILAALDVNRWITLWSVTEPDHPRLLATMKGKPLDAAYEVIAQSVVFSPNGQIMITAGQDRSLLLWEVTDAAHPRQIGSVIADSSTVSQLALSSDGRLLITGDHNMTVLWHLSGSAVPERITELPNRSEFDHTISLSPDGRLLAVSNSATRTVWDISDPTHPVATKIANRPGAGALFSPDGRLLVTSTAHRATVDYVDIS